MEAFHGEPSKASEPLVRAGSGLTGILFFGWLREVLSGPFLVSLHHYYQNLWTDQLIKQTSGHKPPTSQLTNPHSPLSFLLRASVLVN